MVVGANPLEAQTNYFLNHWVPNLRGTSLGFKREELPDEEHAPARIIIVDPRRTVTVNACEAEAGADNVLNLPVKSGTDMVLFNAIFTHIADEGWIDQEFIDAHTDALIAARLANHMERVLREMGNEAYADQFQGFDWETEEDAFMDGYHAVRYVPTGAGLVGIHEIYPFAGFASSSV